MPALKRLVVWLLESLVGAFLLGGLFGAIALPDFVSRLPAVWVGALAVSSVLFLHGYYLTTAVFGVVWRSQRSWVYPVIAVALFVVHTHIVFVRGKPDTSSEFWAAEIPFLLGGACIVLACAFVGNWCLRKWGGWAAPTPGDARSPDGVSVNE